MKLSASAHPEDVPNGPRRAIGEAVSTCNCYNYNYSEDDVRKRTHGRL